MGSTPAAVLAAPVVSFALGNTYALPMLTVTGVATAPTQASGLARLGSDAFRLYLGAPATGCRNPTRAAGPRDDSQSSESNDGHGPATPQEDDPDYGVHGDHGRYLRHPLVLENVRPRPSVVEHLPTRDLANHRASQTQAAERVGEQTVAADGHRIPLSLAFAIACFAAIAAAAIVVPQASTKLGPLLFVVGAAVATHLGSSAGRTSW